MKWRCGSYIECIAILVFALGALILVSRSGASLHVSGQVGGNQTPTAQEAKPFDQEQALAELRKSIAGQENKPAEEVFKNIQLLKGVPAGRLLRVMEIGYARSLGVNCTHCHVAGEWAKEDKPTKQIAREMAAMVRAINQDHLTKIKNLKSQNPVVNCTTCHRGQTKPALNLPENKPGPQE